MKINKENIKKIGADLYRRYYLLLGYSAVASYCKLPLHKDMNLNCTLIIHDLKQDKKYCDLLTMHITHLLCNTVHIDDEIYKKIRTKLPEVGIRDLKIKEFGILRRKIGALKSRFINNKYIVKITRIFSSIKKR